MVDEEVNIKVVHFGQTTVNLRFSSLARYKGTFRNVGLMCSVTSITLLSVEVAGL